MWIYTEYDGYTIMPHTFMCGTKTSTHDENHENITITGGLYAKIKMSGHKVKSVKKTCRKYEQCIYR